MNKQNFFWEYNPIKKRYTLRDYTGNEQKMSRSESERIENAALEIWCEQPRGNATAKQLLKRNHKTEKKTEH